ncbi:MAG: 4Fe-4S dicluster domain-containing protein [Armatimonadota bacterium]
MRRVYCDIRRCLSCRSCEIACAVAHSESGELYQALRESPGPRHLVRVKPTDLAPFPLRCHHCEIATCIDACKTGATHRDPLTGKVLIDRDKCVGCWMCVMVCPFGAVFPDLKTGKALKCDLCEGRDSPACVASCPTRALCFEEFEEFKKEYEKSRPVRVKVS